MGMFDSSIFRLRNALSQLKRKVTGDYKLSFAQCGEDILVEHVFMVLGIKKIHYLDIGAHHPSFLSNTHLFYLKGHRGVCVEADPSLAPAFADVRPEDVCLNVGVGLEDGEADFYVMSPTTLNTFSRQEAERYESYGKHRIERVVKVPLYTVNRIMQEYFDAAPNYVSLDVEGMDLAILQSFDFKRFRPQVFCIETLTYVDDKRERKLTEIIEFMQQQGYFVYADTYINSIFVDTSAWKGRR